MSPPEVPVVGTWWYSGRVNGCGAPATITAWLEPLDAEAGLPCGPVGGDGTRIARDRAPPPDAPSAEVRVFEGGSCPKYADVDLVIAPAPP